MKNQALFSSKDKSKKLKCRLLQFLFGALWLICYLPFCYLGYFRTSLGQNYKLTGMPFSYIRAFMGLNCKVPEAFLPFGLFKAFMGLTFKLLEALFLQFRLF